MKRRIISAFMAIVIVMTMCLTNIKTESAKAADSGKISFTYRYGTNNLIQVNTNLPSDIPLANFTTGQNGCSIDESGNSVQWIGWIGMDNVDGTIVLTFHYNNAFTAGQTYVLPKGAVWGFTDGSTYTLDGDYTFTFDGSSWTMEVANVDVIPEELSFEYRYGTSNLIQVNTNLPSSTPLVNFTVGDNGCNIDQSANKYQQVGWIQMDNASGTIVLTFHFNAAFEAGQTYVLPKGAVFGFTDGSSYPLDADYVFTFDGSSWVMNTKNKDLSFAYRYGTNNLIQVNTDLPSSTPLVNFTVGDNGCNIDQSANQYQQVGWIGMANADGTIVLTFHFNAAFEAGQTYVLPKGAVFGFTDGNTYALDGDYTFTYDGSSWKMSVVKLRANFSMSYRGGASNYVQANTTIPTGLVYDASNSNLIYSSTKTVASVSVIDTETEQVLSVSYGSTPCENGDELILEKGSEFVFEDGTVIYKLDKTWKFTFNGSSWVTTIATSVLSVSGANSYLQPILDASSTENGITLTHNLDESGGTLTSSSIGSYNRDGNALLSVNLAKTATAGDTYIWKKGSTVTVDGLTYYFSETYKFQFDGSRWSVETIDLVNAESVLNPSGVYGSIIQFGGFYNFNVPQDNTKFDFDGVVKIDGTTLTDNVDFWFGGYVGTDTISFNSNADFVNKVLTIEAGTVLSYNDTYVTVARTFNGIWNGTSWKMVPVIVAEKELQQGYTTDSLVQFSEFYDFGLTQQGSLTFDGTVYLDGVVVENPDFVGYPSNTTICLQGIAHKDKVLTIAKDSVISYDGIGVKISKTFHMKYTSNGWTNVDWVYSDVEGDTNGDATVNSMDLVRIKKVREGITSANNQCDLDKNLKYSNVDVHYIRVILLYGSVSGLDILSDLLYSGGEEFVTFADLPADATNPAKIEEFKALGFNTSLVTEDFASPSYYVTVDKANSAEISLGAGEQLLELSYTGYTSGSMIQIVTNLPTDKAYSDFAMGQNGHVLDMVCDGTIWYFQLSYDANTNKVYFNPIFTSTLDNGDQYILKAGSKLSIGGTYYVLDRTYTFTMKNDYLASIQNLDNAGVNIWIRNYSNQAGYFTDYMTNILTLHKDKIDGFYMNDEPFETSDLYDYSLENYNSNEKTDSFEKINSDLVTWFTSSKKHVLCQYICQMLTHSTNQVLKYNHYGLSGDKSANAGKYSQFFQNYNDQVLENVDTADEKKTIGFDYYPFGYTEVEKILWWESTNFVKTGIAPNYLLNMLIPAQKAKENAATFSVCVQTYDKIHNSEKREITTAEEVSMQLYTAMACGADVFEYFAYNSFDGSEEQFDAILDLNGNQRTLYGAVKEANADAFAFADVINVFDWMGTQVSSGTSTNKNATGISTVNNSGLNLLLEDSNNGVLSNISSTDDALVGYYDKNGQAGYMIANYNDPKQVTGNNSVTLTFAGCTRARVYTSTNGRLTSQVVELNNGSYTCNVAPGDGLFIIPA